MKRELNKTRCQLYRLDQSFLIPGLVLSGKGYHPWMCYQCLWVNKFFAKFVCQYPQIFHSFTVYVKGASPNVTSLTALNFLLRQLQQSVLIFSRWLVSFLMMIYFQLSRTYCFVLHPQRHVYVQRRQRCFSSFLFQKKTSSRVLRTSKRNIT